MSSPSYIDLSTLHSIDSLPLRPATADLLDLEKVNAHIDGAVRRGRYHGPTNPREYLLHEKCLVLDGETITPSLAGMLCFGRRPQETLPRAAVDLCHYRGNDMHSGEPVHLEKDIGGTIFDQLGRVQTYLWTNTHHGMALARGSLQRTEVHEYPEPVVRELIVNTLAHRDYTNFNTAARVFLFRNRIEWISPGRLLPGMTVENIVSNQSARNPVILRILYQAGYVEAIGQGLATVVAELRRADMLPPAFEDDGTSFRVTIYGQSLDILGGAGLFADLNPAQRRILALLRTRSDISFREVRELLPDRAERSIQRDIRALLDAQLIAAHGNARSLRYHLRESPNS
jgi:ATP-dependent DNA helicase RecG